ncbi:lipoprotein-releasing system ATP-binding protein LolD [archaeon CG10_big_fil_rev_8_21_14_0_10_43_11]|nr:MAG: lipoprotein-releasing system ATP-binding protein LolD [archaeon CG10_big_fil_rev_8_21_14_0_10_43_11]
MYSILSLFLTREEFYLLITYSVRVVSEEIIRLENVHKHYVMGNVIVKALSGLSLSIKRGELVAIVGSSGSGKSTAMHIIGALDTPTKGNVYFEGKNVSRFSQDELAQLRGRKIGFVFQQFNLIRSSTALENVLLPTVFSNNVDSDPKKRAIQILRDVELGDRIAHKPTELSGGQQQRVAIARALINDPPIILADEPTGNLDSKTGKLVMDYLRKINKEQGKTVIIVTHDLDITKYLDRIIHLKDGRVV